jgi:hypothetical protein
MCAKREPKRDYAREREAMARRPARESSGQAPWRNTRPRANQATHGDDLNRSVEKLRALVGH